MSTTPVITWSGYLAIKVNKKPCPSNPAFWKKSGRLTASKPSLEVNEVVVKISVELPVTLFEEPQLEARITVPSSHVTPQVIDLEVVKDAIAASTGFNVTVVQQEP